MTSSNSPTRKVVAIHVEMPRDMTTAEVVELMNNSPFLRNKKVKVLQYPIKEKV